LKICTWGASTQHIKRGGWECVISVLVELPEGDLPGRPPHTHSHSLTLFSSLSHALLGLNRWRMAPEGAVKVLRSHLAAATAAAAAAVCLFFDVQREYFKIARVPKSC